jgi:hypothetical protein
LSQWDKSVIKNAITALESVIDTDFSYLDAYTLERHKGKNVKVNISGTLVSIYPDLILTQDIKGENHIGALKLHIAKDGLEEDSMKIISSVIYNYLEDVIPTNGKPIHLKLCLSLDVFTKSNAKAPSSYTRRINDVEAACVEIASIWNTL